MPTRPENLLKIGPVHSEIIGLEGTVRENIKETQETQEHEPFGVRCGLTIAPIYM